MEKQKTSVTPAAVYAPTPVPVEKFVDGLRTLSEGIITKQAIYEYLVTWEIRREDLERFKLWLPDRHTRNKIFRNDMMELMLICWPAGSVRPAGALTNRSPRRSEAAPASSASSSSRASTSSADWKRRPGSFARQRCTR